MILSRINFRMAAVLWFLTVSGLLFTGCGDVFSVGDSAKDEDSAQAENRDADYTWMTMNLPWKGLVAFSLFSPKQEKKSDEPEIQLTAQSSFIIYAALGSSRYRVYNVVAIRSDGRVIAAYKDRNSYRYYQKKFDVDTETIGRLRRVLQKNAAGGLPASIISTEDNADSVQGGFTIVAGGRVRRSYFSDYWPKSFQNILDYINSAVLQYDSRVENNGFVPVQKSIITVDPEATLAIRGLIKGK